MNQPGGAARGGPPGGVLDRIAALQQQLTAKLDAHKQDMQRHLTELSTHQVAPHL